MRLSPEEMQRNIALAQRERVDLDLVDGMGVAVSEAWRSGPTAAITRGLKSAFDTSDKITAQEANEKFGLAGTEAEVQPDEELTINDAEARAKDFHELKLNNFITETVNEESPILGKTTQFIAGMAASMVDPAMVALNVMGTGLIAKAGSALANSSKALNTITRVPIMGSATAKGVVSAYAEGSTRSLMSVAAREGVENFLTSTAEEVVAMSVDVGQERLARKISTQERLTNIIAGTVFGTGLGTVMNSDGRKAIARSFARKHGDDAGEYLKNSSLITAEEARIGVQKSGIEDKMYDFDTFGERNWYNETYEFAPRNPDKLFLSVNEEGALHSYSARGDGITLTDNKIHAYNKGSKVIEVETSNLNLITREHMIDAKGRPTKVAGKIMDDLAEDFIRGVDPDKFAKIVAMLKDSEAEIDGLTMNRNQARKALKELMEGKDIDAMVDVIDSISSRHSLDYDPTLKLDGLLDEMGFNGYVYTGKGAQGKPSYNGVYLNSKATKKIKKTAEYETPKAGEGDKILRKHQETEMLKQHVEWLKTEAKSLQADIKDPEVAGIPKQTPNEKAPKTQDGEAFIGTIEKTESFKAVKGRMEAEIEAKITEAKTKAGKDAEVEMEDAVSPELLATKAVMDMIEQGKSREEIMEIGMEAISKFLNCRMGL